MTTGVRMTGRRSRVPLLDRTSRQPTSGASAATVSDASRWRGWSTKLTIGPVWGRSTISTAQACRVDDRAPVSTLALMASTPSSGSATHSRQPMVGVIMDRDAIRRGRQPVVMPGPTGRADCRSRRVSPYARSMFLGEDLLAWLVLALGSAMAVGSLTALVRPPSRPREGELAQAPVARSVVMILVGTVAAIWALASLVSG